MAVNYPLQATLSKLRSPLPFKDPAHIGKKIGVPQSKIGLSVEDSRESLGVVAERQVGQEACRRGRR